MTLPKPLGKRRDKCARFGLTRQQYGQASGVQHEGGFREQLVPSAVDGVAENRRPEPLQVHPQLVSASRTGKQDNQPIRTLRETRCTVGPGHAVEGQRAPSPAGDPRESLAVPRIPSEPVGHSSRGPRWRADRHRHVPLPSRAVVELAPQERVRLGVLCRDDHPRGVLVETVDDARSKILGGKPPRHVLAAEQQGVEKGAAVVPASRVDDHARGLVEHNHVVIFENDDEGQVLRREVEWRRVHIPHRHHISLLHLSRQPGGNTIHRDVDDASAGLAAGEQAELLGHIHVQAHPHVGREVDAALNDPWSAHWCGRAESRVLK